MSHDTGNPVIHESRIARYMDRFIDSIEWIAAFFIGVVAVIVFTTVLLRYFLNYTPPDAYDFSMLMLGIVIFWGIAATSYRGTHITVDLIWANVSPRWQRVIDVFANIDGGWRSLARLTDTDPRGRITLPAEAGQVELALEQILG